MDDENYEMPRHAIEHQYGKYSTGTLEKAHHSNVSTNTSIFIGVGSNDNIFIAYKILMIYTFYLYIYMIYAVAQQMPSYSYNYDIRSIALCLFTLLPERKLTMNDRNKNYGRKEIEVAKNRYRLYASIKI